MSDKLTRRTLDAWLKSGNGKPWLWCGELRGFGAHRRGDGQAAFVVQFRVGRGRSAKRRRVVLGEYPTLVPEQARELAAQHISAGWRGSDPVAERRIALEEQNRQRDTFDQLAEPFFTARRGHLNDRSAGQYESIWRRFILPVMGTKAIAESRRREIADLMDQVEASSGSSTADRVHEQLAIFFRWYSQRDDEFTSPLVRLIPRHRKGTGARSLTDEEIRQFWSACQAAGLAGAAGQFCLLTATRRTESIAAHWTEMSGALWIIPRERYKTKMDHAVPLSDAALTVSGGLEKLSPLLFSATGNAPDGWTLWQAIEKAGGPIGPGLSWHSLRKTARTLMARVGVRSEHAERVLGHVQGAVERAYDKHTYLQEKRIALAALATEIKRVIDGSQSNVIRLAG